jgi:hypothetical protein
MKVRTILVHLVAWLAFIPSAPHGARAQAASTRDVAGEYHFSTRFSGEVISFREDGSYTANASDCTTEYNYSGSYVLRDGVVVVTIKSATKHAHGESESKAVPVPLSDDKESKAGEERAQSSVERYLPVKWGGRSYLIPEDGLLNFCNAVNAGVEPRPTRDDPNYNPFRDDAYFGAFFLRGGDEEKKISGLPQLPEKWQSYLLKSPAEGEVLSFITGDEAMVTVGSRQGLKVGMRLFADSGTKQFWDSPSMWSGLEVISVDETTARVKVYDRIKIGDRVSTKYNFPKAN